MDELVTTRQLQDLLQVDRITIYRMLNDGRLQGFKVGGQWRFSRQALAAWLDEQQGRRAAATTLATSDATPPPEQDLHVSCLQPVQDILAEALGIGALVTLLDGQLLTRPSNPNAFCSLLLASGAQQLCADWWQTTARGLGTGVHMLRCHAGLHCACSRIDVEGRPLAAFFAGQFRAGEHDLRGEVWTSRLATLAKAGSDLPLTFQAELQSALLNVPALDEDGQRRLLRLTTRVVAAFAEIGEERSRLMGRLRRIAEITNF